MAIEKLKFSKNAYLRAYIFLKVLLRRHFIKDVIIGECRQLEYVFLHDCYYILFSPQISKYFRCLVLEEIPFLHFDLKYVLP